jgi:predicted nucleic acid-binding protein
MSLFLLDTNAVSILFKPDHKHYAQCAGVVSGSRLFISFMTAAELLLWPKQNQWGQRRASELQKHVGLFTTLFADDSTCLHWADVVSESRSMGRSMATADAWIAAAAIQWDLPLVTADYRDFEHVRTLTLVPVR